MRTWETRYALLKPARTAKGHRRYSHDDIEVIMQVIDLMKGANSVSQAVRLLRLQSDQNPGDETPLAQLQDRLLHAIRNYNIDLLDTVLSRVLAHYPTVDVVRLLIVPVFHALGDQWSTHSGGIAEEHFFSNYIRNKTAILMNQTRQQRHHTSFIAASLPGEQHELGLLLFCLSTLSEGFRPIYLGANLPLSQLTKAAEDSCSRAIVLGGRFGSDELPELLEQLTDISRRTDLPIFIGGRIVLEREAELRQAGLLCLGNDLQSAAKTLRHQVDRLQRNGLPPSPGN